MHNFCPYRLVDIQENLPILSQWGYRVGYLTLTYAAC